MILVLPIVAAVYFGTRGFGVALLVNFIALPVTVSALRDSRAFNQGKFSSAVQLIFKSNKFLIFILTIANVAAIPLFAFQTLISPWLLIALYSLSILIFYFVNKKNKDKFKVYFRTFCIAPLFINSFFITNYIFSVLVC
ncbi:MAG: hypothetical protein RL204_1885 [Bacteroidota bacterium]|jgi:hypothetical protein